MPRTPKSWREKLAAAKAKPDLPKVFFCRKSHRRLAVPSVADVENLMRRVRRGRLITLAHIVAQLRAHHRADAACPLATGIFAWIIAHAANEAENRGAQRVVPWWRTLKTGGVLNPKFPGHGITQRDRLIAEGHRILQKGKTLKVVDYERALVKPVAPSGTRRATRPLPA